MSRYHSTYVLRLRSCKPLHPSPSLHTCALLNHSPSETDSLGPGNESPRKKGPTQLVTVELGDNVCKKGLMSMYVVQLRHLFSLESWLCRSVHASLTINHDRVTPDPHRALSVAHWTFARS